MIVNDLRLAFRLFRRTPGLTAIAILSIALSVGATAVVFAAVKSVLIDPLPFSHPESLVLLGSEYPHLQQQSAGDWVVWNDSQELLRRARTLQSIGVYRNAVFDLAGDPGSTPEALYGVKVTADLFPTLGVAPMLGRNIRAEEDQPGHSDVMILSYGLWARRFHSDRSVVGRTVTVNGHDCLVIGVMAPGFNFPLRREAARTPQPYVEFWSQMSAHPGSRQGGLGNVARLRPGVSLDAARQEVATIGAALAHDFPALNRDRVLVVNPLRDRALGTASRSLLLLLAAAGLFLLIGCANVANLLLARGLARRREIAIRLAVGAGFGRIVRQLLTESCAMALVGGVGGYLLSVAAWKVLPAVAPVNIPRLAAARADLSVFAFALGVAVLNGILFGIVPALRLASLSASFHSRNAAGGRQDRVRSTLIAAEVALSVLLVVTGGQVLASFVRLLTIDPGFDQRNVLASVVLPSPERYPDPARRAVFYRRMLDALRALPGVDSAGSVDGLPFSGENGGGLVQSADASRQPMTTEIDTVSTDYLATMGIRLMDGRWFREEDMSAGSDTVIVSESVARQFWPAGGAVGQRLCVVCTPESPDHWKRIVGVVTGARHASLDGPEIGSVYLAADAMRRGQFLVVRSSRPSREMEQVVRSAIAAIDPNQPVFLTTSMHDLVSDSMAGRRFILVLLAVNSCLALLLAAAGVYGVISYSTSRRTQEIGIRMAVGATQAHILALVFREGFRTVAVGIGVGLAASWLALRSVQSVLLGVESGHSLAVFMAALLVSVAAAAACWIPARRATRVDPMSALRSE